MMMLFLLKEQRHVDNCIEYIRKLPQWPLIGVTIMPYKKNRTLAQNRTYRMWLADIEQHTGHDAEELHIMFRKKFLGLRILPINETLAPVIGMDEVKTIKSTTELSTQKMSEYMQMVEMVARKLDVPLRYPEDYRYAMYGDPIQTKKPKEKEQNNG
jgi:hypothetical protein